MELPDNIYNRRLTRGQPMFKLWSNAGLMLTWRCSAACAFCYYCCSPKKAGLMTVETALSAWEGLTRLAGDRARIHLTGGEPFLYFDQLARIVQQAHQQGLKGLEYVETNASWAVNNTEIQDRLRFLDTNGMEKLKISWDVFHAEFVDLEAVLRLKEIAEKVLGPDRVLVRWQRYLQMPVKIRGLTEEEKNRIYRQALEQDSCRFTGRAAFRLASLAPQHPAVAFSEKNCRTDILGAKGVHIDPDGNVFSGQCSGIVVGNLRNIPLDRMWAQFDPERSPFWQVLSEVGPYSFLEQARAKGYVCPGHYASKCHLCTSLRRFFFDKKLFWPIISPEDCYLE